MQETNKTLWILAWIFIFCLLIETQMIRGVLEKQEININKEIQSIKTGIKEYGELQDLRYDKINAKKWHR